MRFSRCPFNVFHPPHISILCSGQFSRTPSRALREKVGPRPEPPDSQKFLERFLQPASDFLLGPNEFVSGSSDPIPLPDGKTWSPNGFIRFSRYPLNVFPPTSHFHFGPWGNSPGRHRGPCGRKLVPDWNPRILKSLCKGFCHLLQISVWVWFGSVSISLNPIPVSDGKT